MRASDTNIDSIINQHKIIESIHLEDGKCAVCRLRLANFTGKIVNLYCGHVFHEKCIKEWLKHNQTCPSCNQNVYERSNGSMFSKEGNLPNEDSRPTAIQRFFNSAQHSRRNRYLEESRESVESDSVEESKQKETEP